MASAEMSAWDAERARSGEPSRRLRVLLVTGEYPPDQGGVADYTYCLAQALAERHAAVDVLTRRRPSAAALAAQRMAHGDGQGHGGGAETGTGDIPLGLEGDTERGLGGSVIGEHRVISDWSWRSLRGG